MKDLIDNCKMKKKFIFQVDKNNYLPFKHPGHLGNLPRGDF